MKSTVKALLCAGLITGTLIAPASALEYYYEADLYSNYFYTPTSSNRALDLDSADDTGGSAIVVKSESMEQPSAQSGGASIPVGTYIDPWGDAIEAQISAAEAQNSLAGLSYTGSSASSSTVITQVNPLMFTDRSQLTYTNGHFGAVSIGTRSLFAYVYPSASTESMQKGAGHVDGTSAWNGNVVLCGHNRGSWPYFENLKSVQVGDVITYKTSLGTRTYQVTYSGRIWSTNTDVLQPSATNKITMLTCVANEPSYRYCVIGQQIG